MSHLPLSLREKLELPRPLKPAGAGILSPRSRGSDVPGMAVARGSPPSLLLPDESPLRLLAEGRCSKLLGPDCAATGDAATT